MGVMTVSLMMSSSSSTTSSSKTTTAARLLSRKLLVDPSTIIQKKSDFYEQATYAERLIRSKGPLYDPNEKDPWKKELFQRLDRIRNKCGVLCTINDRDTFNTYAKKSEDSTFGFQITIPTENDESYCDRILLDEDVDASDDSLPFPGPIELEPYYSMNGLVEYDATWQRLNNIYLGGDQTASSTWTIELINDYIEKCKNGMPYSGYGPDTMKMLESIRTHTDITQGGKHVLVLGSERPWLEALVLYLGAQHVTTLEYGHIDNKHPNITTITPDEFRKAYVDGDNIQYDIVVSFSSIEHSGLGRYGDALNPWGDILAIARARCVTKDGGYMVLAVPTQKEYNDYLQFNGHRLYGKNRYPILTANWKQIDGADHPKALPVYMEQPAFVFQK